MVGVADGVGGWADQGVDPSIFATGLMFHAQELASQLSADPFADAEQTDSFSDPRTLLADAYDRVLADGDIVAGALVLSPASMLRSMTAQAPARLV